MTGLSVRARTTITAVVVFAAAAAGSAALLLSVLRSTLVDELDTAVDSRAADIAAQIDIGNEFISLGAGIDSDTLAVVFSVDGGFSDSSDETVDPLQLAESFDAFDEPFGLSLPDLEFTEGSDRMRAVAIFSDVPPFADPGGAVLEIGDEDLITLVATSLDGVDRTVSRIRTGALVLGPALVVLVGLLTWMLSGRALRPVEAIRNQVEAISASDLHRRVPEPGGRDEVARLASTMNSMLDRLEASTGRQRRFVADASHELRSPLAAMQARLDVEMRHPDPDWPTVAESLQQDARRLQRLVDDLLLLARADDDQIRTRQELVDLDDVVFSAIESLVTGDIAVDTSVVSAGLIVGDPDQLQRLVINLVENAVRHAASTVRIELVEQAGKVMMFVDDDGPGIAPEERESVFARFVRLDDARARPTGGSGLGLAICREIVDAHDGRILVGEAPIGGARLGVELPGASRS